MTETAGPVLFAITTLLLLTSHVLYPLALFGWLRWHGEPTRTFEEDPTPPRVSVIVTFVNEDVRCVMRRLRNLLDSKGIDIEVIAVADGSPPDLLHTLNEEFSSAPRIRIIAVPQRKGKSFAQNLGVTHAHRDIVVFTDIATSFTPHTISSLISPLADSSIGCTVGNLNYRGKRAEAGYWALETLIKRGESAWSGLVGATGAIYALRRHHYVPIPPWAQSDLVEPLLVHLSHGLPTRFVAHAHAFEAEPVGPKASFRRKRRIFARAWVSVPLLIEHGIATRDRRLFAAFILHKGLRWISAPLFLLALLGGLMTPSLSIPTTIVLVIIPITALLGWHPRTPASLSIMALWLITLAAQGAAVLDLIRHVDTSAWEPSGIDGEMKDGSVF